MAPVHARVGNWLESLEFVAALIVLTRSRDEPIAAVRSGAPRRLDARPRAAHCGFRVRLGDARESPLHRWLVALLPPCSAIERHLPISSGNGVDPMALGVCGRTGFSDRRPPLPLRLPKTPRGVAGRCTCNCSIRIRLPGSGREDPDRRAKQSGFSRAAQPIPRTQPRTFQFGALRRLMIRSRSTYTGRRFTRAGRTSRGSRCH
jgi:hypothetical protein